MVRVGGVGKGRDVGRVEFGGSNLEGEKEFPSLRTGIAFCEGLICPNYGEVGECVVVRVT